ncbi:MAG: 1,4-dihydroxy-2-naphthoate octaprenyltransferase [Candidatus Sericytochromatia bacterium]|nr:1,4-dihydroxy-2-naphthoate octaprenyltransferase [Candidatus Tanganyikabacteria bacterium]
MKPAADLVPVGARSRGWAIWLAGIRPRTLIAGAAPVLVGTATVLHAPDFRPAPAILALLGALALQAGANLVNDAVDGEAGVDAPARVGPRRLVASGLASAREVEIAAAVAFGVAAAAGCLLAWYGGWPIVAIGVAAILAAIGYTAGPAPLSRLGLGEVAAFAFFGPAAVLGTAGAIRGDWAELPWLAALPTGLLAAALMLANNLRDRESDLAAGKRTLAGRLPAAAAGWLYRLLIGAGWAFPALAALVWQRPLVALAAAIAAPAAWRAWRAIRPGQGGAAVAPALGRTADLLGVAAAAFALAIALGA